MPRSRQEPGPTDIQLGGKGYMLAREPNGEIGYTSPYRAHSMYVQEQLEFAHNTLTPNASSYAIADPRLEVPRGFFNFRDGMGFHEEAPQPGIDTDGYEYGLYIDSGNGYIENGPAVTTVTPTSTGTIRQFIEVDVGGTRRVCALAGRYLLVRTADTAAGWVVADDLGAGGNVFYRAAAFRGTQARTGVFLAVHTSADAPTTGRHWTTATNTTVFSNFTGTPGPIKPVTFVAAADACYAASVSSNQYAIQKFTDGSSNPTLSGTFNVDQSGTLNDMVIFDKRLIIGTTRGLFAPTTAADLTTAVVDVTPEFRYQYHVDNCFPGDTLFRVEPGTKAVSRRWYVGELVEIETAGGHKLAGTPNHPILTDRGWVAISLLRKTDNVICYNFNQAITSDPDIEGIEASASEIFHTAEDRWGIKRRPGISVNFHGDWGNGDIDIVSPNGELIEWLKSTLPKPSREFVLSRGEPVVSAARIASKLSTDSSMLKLDLCSQLSAPDGLGKTQVLDGLRIKNGSKMVGRTDGPDSRSTITQYTGNRGFGNPKQVTDLPRSLTGKITTDNVINISRRPFSGHVYNLETKNGYFAANGIIAANCRGMKPWYNFLVVPLAQSLFRMEDVNDTFEEFGLGVLPQNTSEVQGQPTAICGYRNWTLFACFYDGTNSYLMRWGNWRKFETATGPKRVFVPGWHGALYKFSSERINDMIVSDAAGGNPILYMGGTTGAVYSITLPRFSMAWRSDSNSVFNTTNAGQVFSPIIHHAVPLEPKISLAVGMTSENLSGTTRYIDVVYRTDTASSYAGAGNLESSGRFNVDPGGRLQFTAAVVSRMVQLRATLTTTTSATPCVMKSWAVYQTVRPTFKWKFDMTLRIGDHVLDRRGMPMGRYASEDDMMDSIQNLLSAGSPTSFVSPRGETFDVIITDMHAAAQPNAEVEGNFEWHTTISAVQHRATTLTGTWARADTYTWTGLGVYTWGQLPTL